MDHLYNKYTFLLGLSNILFYHFFSEAVTCLYMSEDCTMCTLFTRVV